MSFLKVIKKVMLGLFLIYFVILSQVDNRLFGNTGQQQSEKAAKNTIIPAKSYTVAPATSKIKIDGILDEQAYKDSSAISVPFEWLPGDNIPAPVKTECFVTYSKSHLYIAFKCYDPDPSKIRAHLMDRDAIDTFIQDDHVSIMIDAFNDERRGFQFRINPLGVQADANFSELEGYEDFSWDAIWQSAGKITGFGYALEIAIPFNQLRFARTKDIQTWGFSFARSYPRSVRHRMTSHRRDRNRNCFLCQHNKLTGFTGMSPGKNLEFDPTLTVNRTDVRDPFPAGEVVNGDFQVEPGITARWGITPNVILNATVNPDFSQIEADVAQLEVNTRFALRYPEKRPFFLEGADFFLTPFEAVFTRTLYNPLWGAKLSSKFGRNAVGFFVVQDRYNNLLFPSNQGSTSISLNENVYNGVFRYRRDIGRGSAVGVLYTGRLGESYHNHVGGVDGFFRLSRSKILVFQFLHSRTKYPEDIAETYNQQEGDFGGTGIRINFNHQSRNLIYQAGYRDISPGFRADSGFIPRVDYRRFDLFIYPIIWGKKGDWFNQLNFPVAGAYTIDYNGNMTDQEISLGAGYQGPLQSNVNLDLNFNRELYQSVTYNVNSFTAMVGMKPGSGINLTAFGRYGDSIDYSNARLARSFLLGPSVELGLGRHLNINLSHMYEKLSTNGERIYTANLSQVRIVYNFNIKTFVRLILQYTDLSRNTDLYNFAIDPEYQGLLTQLLFSYKINPQTVLFLGYSDNYLGFKGVDLTQANRTIFLKIGYALTY